jgi:hypothetical protein
MSEEGAVVAPVVKATRVKKISKTFEGDVLVITAGDKVMKFDINTYSDAIKHQAMLHGFSQKLGDSAAGCESAAEAAEYIQKTAEALAKGDWTTKSPAGEKITKKSLLDKFAGLSEKERALAEPLMKKLGLI